MFQLARGRLVTNHIQRSPRTWPIAPVADNNAPWGSLDWLCGETRLKTVGRLVSLCRAARRVWLELRISFLRGALRECKQRIGEFRVSRNVVLLSLREIVSHGRVAILDFCANPRERIFSLYLNISVSRVEGTQYFLVEAIRLDV